MRPRIENSPFLYRKLPQSHWGRTPDHTMIGYRHPTLFTHEHGCVSNTPTSHIDCRPVTYTHTNLVLATRTPIRRVLLSHREEQPCERSGRVVTTPTTRLLLWRCPGRRPVALSDGTSAHAKLWFVDRPFTYLTFEIRSI